MFISQNHSACKYVGRNTIKPSFGGNLVPNIWYHKLLRPCGKSDTTAIAILSELLFLYRYNGDTEFRLNFKTLAEKFNFGVDQVKNAIVRLETHNLIARDLRTIAIEGRAFVNEMFLIINVENLLNLTEDTLPVNLRTPTALKYADNIDKNNLKKISRSSKFNFFKKENKGQEELSSCSNSDCSKQSISNISDTLESQHLVQSNTLSSLEERGKEGTEESEVSPSAFSTNRFSNISLGKALSEFHPLTREEAESLQIKSGRDFDLNFINQLMLKVSDKYPDRLFYSRKSVLNYMAKLLTFEMRDAVKVSNSSFKFAKSEDKEAKEQESYLQQIESNLDTSYVSQLKRKIAAVFAGDVAYSLLLGSSFEITEDNEFRIIVNSSSNSIPQLTNHQQQLLLSQVRAVYGNQIEVVSLSGDIVSDLTSSKYQQTSVKSESVLEGASVWDEVRKGLIEYFKDGEYLDKAWFSKLKAKENIENRNLTLEAPTNFIRDYVTREYKGVIAKYCLDHQFQLEGVYT